MVELTLKEAIDGHRKLWSWLANETLERGRKVEKYKYFVKHEISYPNVPFEQCYCCEYVAQNSLKGDCENCPLRWGSVACYRGRALFIKWKSEDNYIKAAKIAMQIANLPLKKRYAEQYEKECREYMKSKAIPDSYKENMMNKFMEVK